MSDLVERLRSTHPEITGDEYWRVIYAERKEAADEIERLRHSLREWRKFALGKKE